MCISALSTHFKGKSEHPKDKTMALFFLRGGKNFSRYGTFFSWIWHYFFSFYELYTELDRVIHRISTILSTIGMAQKNEKGIERPLEFS